MLNRINHSISRTTLRPALLLLSVVVCFILVKGGSETAVSIEPGLSLPHYSVQAVSVTSTYTAYLPIVFKAPYPFTAIQPAFGVNFINSVDHPATPQMLANGLATGATWNRWPLYWFRIETDPGEFDWSQHDPVVLTDLQNGWQTNAILLGTPAFYMTGTLATFMGDPSSREAAPGRIGLTAVQAATPQGLYQPIFTDGTDTPGPGKLINADNRWARFVYQIVNRYKPGGALAELHGLSPELGITHWEMWNEPDLDSFWNSSVADYARLLKVGYLAAKQADPQAHILFGGLANFQKPHFYRDVLTIHQADPMAAPYGYFHDIMATHNYSNSWRSWYEVWRIEQTWADYDLSKPIWLNESGVPAWDDYPGPTWIPTSSWRATTTEQADFVIQSAFYALFAGADAIFHFQLYDGCGNQPLGTDFPPHHGELCDENGRLITNPDFPCAGDANGLFSNPSDAVCFSQHPTPESPRLNFTAFQLLSTYLTEVAPLWRARPGGANPNDGPQEHIALYNTEMEARIIGMWARFGGEETAVVPAHNDSAQLLYPDGTTETIYPEDGVYTITLPPATNLNNYHEPGIYQIGGPPRILIEYGEP
jgi:hypothetical protein